MTNYIIRTETENDYPAVENLTREAFWNVYVPGCSEHYFVHTMRSHKDFIPELAFVMELEGKIIGSIMYYRTSLTDESGNTKEVLSFGPLGILPDYQRKGYGKALMKHSFAKAKEMGYDAVVILGSPSNYVSSGFRSCKKYNVGFEGGIFPAALLVKELTEGVLAGRQWIFNDSSISLPCQDAEAVADFDKHFPYKEKLWQSSQEEFYIHSHSVVAL